MNILCQDIVLEFESGVKKYFNEEDLEKGYLEVPNRKCILEQFPTYYYFYWSSNCRQREDFTMAIRNRRSSSTSKTLSKKVTPGSTYIIDRRKMEMRVPSCAIPKKK